MNAVPSPTTPSSSSVNHVDALPPGTRLAEFEIVGLLGVGGFGMVYQAFDHSLHRAVAIKEYMPSAMAGRAQGQSLWVRSANDQQTFQAGLASFVDEARLLAQFDHPSLVKVFRFWEANNTAYMVMPLYSGLTFKQARTCMRTPPSEAWLRKLLWSVLGALRVLHEGKTLHRDISPDNIFLQDNGPPVLLDLGAARHAINDQGHKHTAVLKVNYAPIEQYAEGDDELRQGPWSDLYSLAAVVHGCLCNDTPLPATLRSIRDRMVSFSRVARTVKRQFGVEYSAPFVAAIARSLALRPEDRPQSIDEFLQIMEMTTAPEGIESFDFRADLGDTWTGPTVTSSEPLAAGQLDARKEQAAEAALTSGTMYARAPASLAKSEMHARIGKGAAVAEGSDSVISEGGDTVFFEAGDTVVSVDSRYDDPRRQPADGAPVGKHRTERRSPVAEFDGAARLSPKPIKSRKRPMVLVWLGLAVVAVVASAAGLRWTQGTHAARDDIITEIAEPRATLAAVTSAPADGASAAAAAEQVTSAPTEGIAGTVPATGASAPVPAFVAASAAAAGRAARAPKRVTVESAPAAVVRDEPSPPPPPAPAVPAEARPRPSPPKALSPQESCADASFLARPLCIHQECQKASHAAHPICVENRRRQEAEEQRRRLMPN